MEQKLKIGFRPISVKRVRRGEEAPQKGRLPALVMQVGRVKRLLLGQLPGKGVTRCMVVTGSEADADAVYLQATHPQDPFARADAANRLLQLLQGNCKQVCERSGLSPQELNALLLLSRFSVHERQLAAACGLSQQALVHIAARDELQRRRLLVAAANRKKLRRQAAQQLDGAQILARPARAVRDERIVKNTLQNATEQICRAGFDAALSCRAVSEGTAYRIVVRPPGGAAKSAQIKLVTERAE